MAPCVNVNTSHIRALLVRKVAFYVAKIFSIFGIEFPESGFSAQQDEGAGGRDALLDVVASFRKEVGCLLYLGQQGSHCAPQVRETAIAIGKGQANTGALHDLTDKVPVSYLISPS